MDRLQADYIGSHNTRTSHFTTYPSPVICEDQRQEAEKISSDREQPNHSFSIIDNLLKQNGYIMITGQYITTSAVNVGKLGRIRIMIT